MDLLGIIFIFIVLYLMYKGLKMYSDEKDLIEKFNNNVYKNMTKDLVNEQIRSGMFPPTFLDYDNILKPEHIPYTSITQPKPKFHKNKPRLKPSFPTTGEKIKYYDDSFEEISIDIDKEYKKVLAETAAEVDKIDNEIKYRLLNSSLVDYKFDSASLALFLETILLKYKKCKYIIEKYKDENKKYSLCLYSTFVVSVDVNYDEFLQKYKSFKQNILKLVTRCSNSTGYNFYNIHSIALDKSTYNLENENEIKKMKKYDLFDIESFLKSLQFILSNTKTSFSSFDYKNFNDIDDAYNELCIFQDYFYSILSVIDNVIKVSKEIDLKIKQSIDYEKYLDDILSTAYVDDSYTKVRDELVVNLIEQHDLSNYKNSKTKIEFSAINNNDKNELKNFL